MGSIISMDVSMQTLYKHYGSTTGALCYHGRLHEATMDVWRSSPWIDMVGPWGLSMGLPWKNSVSIGTSMILTWNSHETSNRPPWKHSTSTVTSECLSVASMGLSSKHSSAS